MVRWRGAHLAQLVLVQHAVQLVARLANAVTIVRVDDEDDTLRVLVVMAPERPDLVLAADVCRGSGWVRRRVGRGGGEATPRSAGRGGEGGLNGRMAEVVRMRGLCRHAHPTQ